MSSQRHRAVGRSRVQAQGAYPIIPAAGDFGGSSLSFVPAIQNRPTESIRPNPANPRTHSKRQIKQAALKAGVAGGAIGQVLAAAKGLGPWSSAVQQVQLGGSEIRVTLVIPFDPVIHMDRVFPFQMRRRGVESRLVVPGHEDDTRATPDPALVKAVGRAMRWWEMLTTGRVKSVPKIAA